MSKKTAEKSNAKAANHTNHDPVGRRQAKVPQKLFSRDVRVIAITLAVNRRLRVLHRSARQMFYLCVHAGAGAAGCAGMVDATGFPRNSESEDQFARDQVQP